MEDLRLRNSSSKNSAVSGKVQGKHSFSIFSLFLREFKPVYKDSRFQRIIWLGLVNISSLLILLSWCSSTESMGLLAYTYITFFDTLCLCLCALSIWVEQKKPNSQYTFGYERVEVLAVFVSTTFACVSSVHIIKESMGRWMHQAPIHTARLLPGIIVAFMCHMLITYCMKNKGLNLVVCASDSSWLQNQMSSVSHSLTHIIPGFSNSSWPRVNPFSLLGCVAGGISILALFFIDIYDYHGADAISGIFLSLLTSITMYPISAYSAKILLQGTPPHIADLLDKCLREASTFDGVLEFRNEHFWLLGFDKIVGTVHVRIRRDANEQIVLSHLLNKLSSLVTDITIQVFKDEWAWSSSTRQILNESFMKFPPVVETYSMKAATSNIATNSAKSPAINSNSSFKGSFPSTYPNPNMNVLLEPKQPSHSYAAVPLPPSLSGSHNSKSNSKSEHFSIDMPGAGFAPKRPTYDMGQQSSSQTYHVTFSPETTTTLAGKYSKELNPLYASSSEYMKTYRT